MSGQLGARSVGCFWGTLFVSFAFCGQVVSFVFLSLTSRRVCVCFLFLYISLKVLTAFRFQFEFRKSFLVSLFHELCFGFVFSWR